MKKTLMLILISIIISGFCIGFSAETVLDGKTDQEITEMILAAKEEYDDEFKTLSRAAENDSESVTEDVLIAFAEKYYTGDKLYGFMHNDSLFYYTDGVLHLYNEDAPLLPITYDTFECDGSPLKATGYYKLIRNGSNSFYLIEERDEIDWYGYRYPVTLYKYIDGRFKIAAASAEDKVECGDEYEYEDKDFAAYAIATDIIGRYISLNGDIPESDREYSLLDMNVTIELVSYTLDNVTVKLTLPEYDEYGILTELKHYDVSIKRVYGKRTAGQPNNLIYYFDSFSQDSTIESVTFVSSEKAEEGKEYSSEFSKCSHSETRYEGFPGYHLKICSICGRTLQWQGHFYVDNGDERVCEKCGVVYSDEEPADTPAAPDDPQQGDTDDPIQGDTDAPNQGNTDDPQQGDTDDPQQPTEPENSNTLWIVIGSAVFVIAIIAVAILITKKKSNT